MNLDWSFARPVDVGGMIRNGIEEGVTGGAVNALMRDPNNQNAMAMLGRFNPQAALTMQDRQSQQALRAEQTEQRRNQNRRDNIILGASFLEGVQDEAGWQRAITQARAAGVQLEGVPPNFDPAFVNQVRTTAQALIRAGQRGQAQQRPYRWRNNAGDLMELDANGQPRVVFDDPQARTQWITHRDPETGQVIAIQAPNSGAPAAPQASDDDEWDYEEGGSGSSAPSTFPGGIW